MQEGCVGPGQLEDHRLVIGSFNARQFGCLAARYFVVAGDHAEIAAAGTLRGRTDGALERIFDVSRGHYPAIVEFDAVTQREHISQAIVGNRVTLGEIGFQFCRARLVVHEAVENRLDHRPVLPIVAHLRVERGEVVVEGDPCSTSLFWRICEGGGCSDCHGECRCS